MSGLSLLPHAIGQPAPDIMYATVSANQPLPASFADPLYVVEPHRPNQYREIPTWVASSLPSHGAPVMVVRDNYGNETAFVGAQHAAPSSNATEINGTAVPLTSSAWVTPTLINAWTARTLDPPGYFKDPLGFVHLRGRLTGGGVGTTAFILPVGFRPGNNDDLYPIAAYNGSTAVAAFADIVAVSGATPGSVVIFYAAGTTDVGLGGISFLAEN